MSQDRSTYLTIFLHNNDDFNIHLEFLPLDSDVDGIWVRTTLTAQGFTSQFTWFLASIIQRDLALVCCELGYDKEVPAFEICDTDCSFEARFRPSSIRACLEVEIEGRWFLEKNGPAIALDVRNATARIIEVRSLLQRLSAFE